MEKFEKLGLCEHVLKTISAKKFTEPSEIQEKTIPLIMEGKDVIAGSATGSGKTLAFGSGLIKSTEKGGGIKGLILTPTRELAEQVAGAIKDFAYHKDLEVTPVYGGVSIENQIKRLAYSDIVVATPGRLLDHLQRNSIDLSKVKTLILDEADRMWDMGFKDDVAKIVRECPKERQTLLFSATITQDLASFADKYMNSPTEISVKSYVDTSKLKQVFYDVQDNLKFSLLVHLLKNEKSCLVMIFCNTRRNADFVTKNLRAQKIDAQVIHGGLTQARRNQVLKKFDSSNVSVLVCTDVAARGLDISGVSHVYNYDVASDAKDHVHRIGRTARAGAEGSAISILGSRDYDNFANLQRRHPEMKIERAENPRIERVSLIIEPRREGGRFSRGGNSRGGGRSSGGFGRSGGRSFGGRGRSDGPRRSSSGGSSGPRRSEGGRSFGGPRRSDGPRRSSSSNGGRSGFHGSGRNTRRSQSKRD
jgi:superfamily II DNA/RNA helicase